MIIYTLFALAGFAYNLQASDSSQSDSSDYVSKYRTPGRRSAFHALAAGGISKPYAQQNKKNDDDSGDLNAVIVHFAGINTNEPVCPPGPKNTKAIRQEHRKEVKARARSANLVALVNHNPAPEGWRSNLHSHLNWMEAMASQISRSTAAQRAQERSEHN